MRSLCLAFVLLGAAPALPAAALAAPYLEYPAPVAYPFQRTLPTGRVVVIPPYVDAFTVRVYTTPPQQPLYNVPPYAVITPY